MVCLAPHPSFKCLTKQNGGLWIESKCILQLLKNVICSGDGVRLKKCFCNSKTANL